MTCPAPRIYVVVLNWNGWRDTIECLESVFRLEGAAITAVVCDNASDDESVGQIEAWAKGEVGAQRSPMLPAEPVRKPLAFRRLSRSQAEREPSDGLALVLIDTGGNLGFAGGCNVGIRHALRDPRCSHVWLLNNDSVAAPDALARMLALLSSRPRVGLCGSQVCCYERPAMVQTFGGLLNRWFFTTHSLANGATAGALPEPAKVDYVPGASMLATRAFLENVGLMSEDYFLYFEEIDWAVRAKGRFELAVCSASVVFHRGGASIGTPGDKGERGLRSEFYLLRGRLLFAKRVFPWRLPTAYLGMVGSLLARLHRRQWGRAKVALGVLLGVEMVRGPTPQGRATTPRGDTSRTRDAVECK